VREVQSFARRTSHAAGCVAPAAVARSIASLAVGLALLGVAGAATATNLVDVRVGVHKAYTRVVLETDAAARFSISRKPRELVVHVAAASRARAITARSPHLTWVKVQPAAGGGSDVRIQLRGPSTLKQLVLHKPDRLVLDVSAAAQTTPASAAKPKPVATAAQPKLGKPAASAAPTVSPGSVPGSSETALKPSGPPPRGGPALPPPAGTSRPGGAAAPGQVPTPKEKPLTVEVLRPTPGARSQTGHPTPLQPVPHPLPAPRTRLPAPSGPLDFLPPPLNQPTTLGLVALIFVALVIWMRLRVRRRRIDEEAADLSPFDRAADDEAAGAAEAGGGPQSPGEAETQGEAEASVFAAPAADEPVAPAIEVPAPTPATPAAPVPGTAADSGELERRLAHLETRLEEMVDAKERLERQVAAQTEELRVQRAAIARTQRVVRSISANPEDEATEPAPKG